MITLNHLTLQRGTKRLFENVTVSLYQKQHVGLIGLNGSGKSSLFALLLGQLAPDGGDYLAPSGLTMAHLAQAMPDSTLSAIQYVMRGDQALGVLLDRLLKAEEADDFLQIGEIHSKLYELEGYAAEAKAGKILNGLGFSSLEHHKSVNSFSVGWRMRLNLAQVLMTQAEFLLLDEPTNHLDLDAIVWLEDWLRSYEGTLMLISHDREFLDNTVNVIWHIENQTISAYTGNYSDFETLYAQKIALQQAAFEKQQAQVKHIRKFIDRFRAKATKAKQAQSRVKALERMESVAEVYRHSPLNFSFYPAKPLSPPVLSFEDVSFQYESGKTILEKIDFYLRPEDRIGLLGKNGAGKTTLIKLLARQLQPQAGKVFYNHQLRIGYFSQNQMEQLTPDKTPLEHFWDIDPLLTERELRRFFGGFGFSNDYPKQPIRHFSGGEKARLVLALLVWQKPNLLLLDEPTNHLDLEMRESLTFALQSYTGTVILVSHDRYLVRAVADELHVVHRHRVSRFEGDLDMYRAWLLEGGETDKNKKHTRELIKPEPKPLIDANKKKLSQQKKWEVRLLELNEQKKALEVELADAKLYESGDREKLSERLIQMGKLKKEMAETEDQWLSTI